jgi:hypothetical protein
MRKKFFLTFFIIVTIASNLIASLTVDPIRLELKVDRNAVYKGSYLLKNNYNGDVEVKVTLSNWVSYKGNENLDVNEWLKVVPDKVLIKEGETRLVLYTIYTNESMEGSVAGQVSFTLQPPGNSSVNVKMTCPVYLSINGTERIDFNIIDVKFSKKNNNIDAQVNIENNGNVNIRPVGTIYIYDRKNNLMNYTDMPASYPVYSDTKRDEFIMHLPPKQLPPGRYKAVININALGKTSTKNKEFRINKNGSIETLK